MALPETSVLTRAEIFATLNALSIRRNQVKEHVNNLHNPPIVKAAWAQTIDEITIIEHKLYMQLEEIDRNHKLEIAGLAGENTLARIGKQQR